MATSRTSVKLPTPPPRPEYLDITRMIARRARTVTGIYGLAVLVVDEDFGAAARFVPATNEVHIHHSVMERVNPREIRSVAELNAKHPEIMGAVLHELFHAMHSMNARQMDAFQRQHGTKVYGAIALLDEGRIESLGYPKLSGIEQEALRAMVPEFVLRDVDPDDEPDELVKSIRQGIRLVGLLAARADAEILDIENPRCEAIWAGTVLAMGEWFSPFFKIAQRFAAIQNIDLNAMKALADEWIELEAVLIKKAKPKDKKPPEDTTCGQPGEPSDEESEPGEPGDDEEEGDGEGESEGESEGQEEGEDEGSGKGAGEDEGEGEGGSEDGSGGSDEGDEGQDGEGDDESSSPGQASEDGDGDEPKPSLGEYEGSTGEEEVDIEAIKEIIKSLPEAAQEQREASGKRLKEQVWAMERVIIADHEERRRKNKEAARLWL